MDIITDYDKLSERSDEIDTKKENKLLREIITNLKNEVESRNLTGLAAPQLGYDKRVFVINFKGKVVTYVNPIVTSAKNMHLSKEDCPSFPKRLFIRPRFNEIKIMFQNPMGKSQSQKLIGLAAVVFQELTDHLDGLLLPDIALEIDEMYENASEEEQHEVLEAYLKSLDITRKEVEDSINNDPEAKQLQDAVNFMESVKRGETHIQIETVKR